MTRFITYTTRHYDKLIQAVLEHFEIVGLTLVISIALAFMIAMLVMEHKRITAWITRVFSMIYAIPSLALFALLLPVTGLGMQTAVLVLVIYNQFILIQSFTDGFTSVDAGVLEAAAGMGMTKGQIFRKVRLPLALDTMIAGVHISIISTIGIATIASTVGAGGLGTILFDGAHPECGKDCLGNVFVRSHGFGGQRYSETDRKTSEEETVSGIGSGEKERLMDSRGQTSLWKK